MRLFSLFFAMLMLFSACQPQKVTTEEGVVIQVSASVPSVVATDSVITLSFSAAIPASTDLSAFFDITPALEGTFDIASDGMSATFSPTLGWEPGVSYEITVSDNVSLGNNDSLAANTWTVQSPEWTDPAILYAVDGTARAWDMATDSKGNVFVVGQILGYFDAKTDPENPVNVPATSFHDKTPSYYVQGFLLKYSASGELLWSQLLDNGTDSHSYHISVLSDDSLVLLLRTHNDAANPSRVLRLDNDGTALAGSPWMFESDTADSFINIGAFTATTDGDVYLYGQTDGSIDGAESGWYFVMKYSKNGQRAWVKQFDPIVPNDGFVRFSVWNMQTDQAGGLYLNVTSNATVLGSNPIFNDVTTSQDGMVIKFTATGELAWIKRYGDEAMRIYAEAMLVTEEGEVYASLEFYDAPEGKQFDSVVLNATDGVAMIHLNSAGEFQNAGVFANDGGWVWPTDLVHTQDNTVVGIGVYGNDATPESTWLSEWDAQGNLYRQQLVSDIPADYDTQLTINLWGQTFMASRQNDGVLVRKVSFD